MTRGQQIILFIIVILLLGVIALLAITLINTNDAASPVPTLAALITATVPPARQAGDVSAAAAAPPTWTPAPTRTSPATSTPRATHTPPPPPTITPTFFPTLTPRPTQVVTPTRVALTVTTALENPGFEGVSSDFVPGWSWWAEDNFTPGGDYNPDTSYETPLFKQADDPVRVINGPTLQIDAVQHLKFKVHVFQTVPVSPTYAVDFQVLGSAFSDSGLVQMAAGIDPGGGAGCAKALWGELLYLDQSQPVQPIVAPRVTAGNAGKVTVCLYAEPIYPAISNAAFFDEAELTVKPPAQAP